MQVSVDRSVLEIHVQRFVARFARLLPCSTVEGVRSFVGVLSRCLVEKLEEELPRALRKNRVDDLEKRLFRWLEESFWQDICDHPDDDVDRRTRRLEQLFDSASKVPPRRGDGEHFPISVFIEYELLLNALKPHFKRRPSQISRLPKKAGKIFVDHTIGGDRGYSRPRILRTLNQKRLDKWETSQLSLAEREIEIQFWPAGEYLYLEADDVLGATASTAALQILGRKMNLSNDAVLKVVKAGKQMLPPHLLEKLEEACTSNENKETWEFLNQLDPIK